MSEPVFLTMEDVEFLHRGSIRRFGGTHGVRDRATLESAVNQPKNLFYYGQGDVFEVAAGYAFHIAQAQAFLDGNKRTAMAARSCSWKQMAGPCPPLGKRFMPR